MTRFDDHVKTLSVVVSVKLPDSEVLLRRWKFKIKNYWNRILKGK